MSSPRISPSVREILVCPDCRGHLRVAEKTLECTACGQVFALDDGVPIFFSGAVKVMRDHSSNPIGSQFEEILRAGDDFVLNIGAGGTATRYPNCIEFAHKIFRHTDVVGDAHQLPFRDGVFDRVFAFNVFEHLREPKTAAREIRRVLKPGGIGTIHTAFLQALHEEPNHFYNATEYGVREWFSDFEDVQCTVSGNFGPGVMLAFLMSNVLEAVRLGGATERDFLRIGDTTIGEWAEFWAKRGQQPPGFEFLQNLPQTSQARIAAGFQLIARKPLP